MAALCLPRRSPVARIMPAWLPSAHEPTRLTLPPGGSPSRPSPAGGAPLRCSPLRASLDVAPRWAVTESTSPAGLAAPTGRPGLGARKHSALGYVVFCV